MTEAHLKELKTKAEKGESLLAAIKTLREVNQRMLHVSTKIDVKIDETTLSERLSRSCTREGVNAIVLRVVRDGINVQLRELEAAMNSLDPKIAP